MPSKFNGHNIRYPRDEEGDINVKSRKYGMNNQPKKATFKYEQEGRLFLGVAKIEGKKGTVTGKRCLVFDYTGKKTVPIDAYQK